MSNLNAVIYIVGAALILCVIGIVALAVNGNTIPDVLQNIAVGSLAGLIGLLVPAKTQQP